MDGLGPGLFAVLVVGVAGVLDLLYREIEPLYWIFAIPVGGLLYLSSHGWLLEGVEPVLVGLSFIPVIAMGVLYLAGAVGGADVLALLFIAVAYPVAPGHLLPIPIQAILYASIPSLIHRTAMAWSACGSPRCILSGRVRVEGWRLLRDPRFRWWLVSDKRAGGMDVGAETWEIVARLGPQEEVEAAPGLPYVAHLAVGLIAALLLGDDPLVTLIGYLLGLGG